MASFAAIQSPDYGAVAISPPTESPEPSGDRKASSSASSALSSRQTTPSLRSMTAEQRKKYACAMGCRAGNTLIETTTDMFKSCLSGLLGLQLSGLLNASTETDLWGYLHLHLWLNGQEVYAYDQSGEATVPSVSLGGALDGIFPTSMNNMILAASAAWLTAHAIGPRLQRILSTKEGALMREVNGLEPLEPSAMQPTNAGKLNDFLQYVMPFVFEGPQLGLFLQIMQNAGSNTTNWGWQHNPFNYTNGPWIVDGSLDIGSVTVRTIPGEGPLSKAELYALVGIGIAAYMGQAMCNFIQDLRSKGGDLARMSGEERKKCLYSLANRAVRKGLQTLNEQVKGALSLLSAIELSGFLNILTQSTVEMGLAYCVTVGASDPQCGSLILGTAQTDAKPLGITLNKFLILPVEQMLYAAAAAWGLSQTLGSYVMRRVLRKEETLMRQALQQEEPSAEKQRTVAGIAAHILDCISPLLDAAAASLLIHYISGTNAKITLPDTPGASFDLNLPQFSLDGQAGILSTIFEMCEGLDPVSVSTLWILLAGGIATYLGRAWCNFHHDLQTQETESPAVDSNSPTELPDVV